MQKEKIKRKKKKKRKNIKAKKTNPHRLKNYAQGTVVCTGREKWGGRRGKRGRLGSEK